MCISSCSKNIQIQKTECSLFQFNGGLGGPEEDRQLHHCCWTGRVGEREEEEDFQFNKQNLLRS